MVTPRWGQLTYASFDPDNGAGGWQVMSTSGDLSEGEIEALRQRIVTRFDSDTPLGAFPNAAELEAMPRRLTYICDGRGQGAYWHSTMAGRDSTGRPGNVFSHVLLDRATAQPTPAIRPIEIWRSPSLLCPFGPEQVREAVLEEDVSPSFGSNLGRQEVLDFLFDQAEWRVGLLSALLDAVSAALNGGPGVVLVADSAESAALWIAAVSTLAPADWVRRLNFSVYERAAGLDAVFDRGVHLIGVPRADADAVSKRAGFIILDEHEVPDLGEVGGRPHQSQAGSLIEPTHWSALAQAALVDQAAFAAATSIMDDVADRVGDSGQEPGWALAMAALRLPDLFGDYEAEAAAVVARHSPDSLSGDDELMQLARATMQRSSGGTAGEAWAELEQEDTSPLMRRVLMQTYLQRSLEDDDWLARPGSIPLPSDYRANFSTPELRQAARSAILRLQRKFSGEEETSDLPTTALRILDFIHRAGLVGTGDGSGTSLEEAIAEILERTLLQVVDDDELAQKLVSETGALVAGPLRRKILEAVQDSARFRSQPAGNRIPPAFCGWLFGAFPAAAVFSILTEPDAVIPAMTVEHAIWLCWNGEGHLGGARVVAAAGVLEPGQIDVVSFPVLDRIFQELPPWRASELVALEKRFPGQTFPEFFPHALLSEVWSEPLAELVGLVLDRDVTALTAEVLFARLRLDAMQPWADGSPGEVGASADRILSAAVLAMNAVDERLAPELRALILKAAVIAVANPRNRFEFPREMQSLAKEYASVQADGVYEFLQTCVDARVLGQAEIQELTRLAIETAPGYPGAEDVVGDFLSGVTVFAGTDRVPLLEVPVRHAIRTGQTDPQTMCDAILAKNWNQSFNTGSERLVEKNFEERQKFSREWWKRLRQDAGPTVLDTVKPARFGGFMSAIRKDR